MADGDLTARPTRENDPTLAAHAQAAEYGINLSSTKAAYIAEAVLAASGLRERLAARDAVIAEALAPHYAINTDVDGERCHECWKPWPCATFLDLSRVPQGAAEPSGCEVCAGVQILDGRPMHCEACGAPIRFAEPWTDPEPWVWLDGTRHDVGQMRGTYKPRSREQYDAEEARRG